MKTKWRAIYLSQMINTPNKNDNTSSVSLQGLLVLGVGGSSVCFQYDAAVYSAGVKLTILIGTISTFSFQLKEIGGINWIGQPAHSE